MNQSEIVDWMHKWLSNHGYEIEGDLGEQQVTDVIDSSLDVVELTMDLEDAVHGGEDTIDLEELAPKFASLSFSELSGEIVNLVGSKQG